MIERVRSEKEFEFYKVKLEVDELEQIITGPEAQLEELEKRLENFTENELIQ